MNIRRHLLPSIALALGVVALPASAADGRWNFSLGLAYVSGFSDVKDFYVREYSAEASSFVPVGLMFTPYYETKSGWRFCLDVGPVAAALGSVSFVDVPVGLSAGYRFRGGSRTWPYVRAGMRYHFAGGDNIDGSTPGVFAGLGLDFGRESGTRWGIELAVDTSDVKFQSTDWVYDPNTGHGTYVTTVERIKPGKLLLNAHVVF
jgi:hypothetical protein